MDPLQTGECKNVAGVSSKMLKIELPDDPAISVLGISKQLFKTKLNTNIHSRAVNDSQHEQGTVACTSTASTGRSEATGSGV